MENTLENKEKFFMHYYGQQALAWQGATSSHKGMVVSKRNFDSVLEYHLELKNLSDISDEEAEVVQQVLGISDKEAGFDTTKEAIKDCLAKEGIVGLLLFDFYGNTLRATDYLRSREFLLPFHDLTPDQIISYGWARYAEPK